ncbi:hypothetical protein RRG08_044318 [Elysia crispata]|uniref:Uncharacterized protein n=1 Tax=Elysia crispata TaxID=231223 RepID=A0AAE0ZBL9_9GAST|nr:hypothetical protein RRG08_044318 [Elysia crispata]
MYHHQQLDMPCPRGRQPQVDMTRSIDASDGEQDLPGTIRDSRSSKRLKVTGARTHTVDSGCQRGQGHGRLRARTARIMDNVDNTPGYISIRPMPRPAAPDAAASYSSSYSVGGKKKKELKALLAGLPAPRLLPEPSSCKPGAVATEPAGHVIPLLDKFQVATAVSIHRSTVTPGDTQIDRQTSSRGPQSLESLDWE